MKKLSLALLCLLFLGASRDCRTASVDHNVLNTQIDPQIAALAVRIEKLESQVSIGGGIDTIFSWILATSFPITALGIVLYVLSHRIPFIRHAWDKAKGKP